MNSFEWVLVTTTLGTLGAAAFIGWRFDWRPSIQSRGWCVLCAALSTLLATPVSIALMAWGLMAQADAHLWGREPGSPWWALYVGGLPIAVSILIVVLASARRNRPWAVAAGLVAMVTGYSAIFGFTFLDTRLNMVTPITYENLTNRPVEIWHQKDGDSHLYRDFPSVVGSYVNTTGYRVQDRWIRIVVRWQDGSTALDRSYTWDELRSNGGRIVIVGPES